MTGPCLLAVLLAGGGRRLALGDAAHGRDQLVAVEGSRPVAGDDLAVAHDHDAVGILQDLAEQVGDQDAAQALGDRTADMRQELAGRMGVQRRRRLVEDDEMKRVRRHREGARHLHHLAPSDRQVADGVGRPDAVAGKDLVELAEG